MAMERTGRTLRLQGELKLVFFPSLGAGVAGVTLSERAAAGSSSGSSRRMRRLKLLPLLHGQVIVDAVRVSGLRAQLVKNKDGTYNFSDLLEGGEAKPAAKPAPEKKGKSAPVKFDIAGITMDRASILYRDLSSGQEISLTDVSCIPAASRRMSRTRSSLRQRFKRNQPLLEAKVALNATYSLKPDAIGLDFTAKLDDSNVKGKLSMARAASPLTASTSRSTASTSITISPLRRRRNRQRASRSRRKRKKLRRTLRGPVGAEGPQRERPAASRALQVQGLKLSNLKAQLKAADGRAEINPHSASLYEGELTGTLTVDGNANRIALKETLTNVSVGPLLRDAAQQDRLEGRGNVALDVTAAVSDGRARCERSLVGARVRCRGAVTSSATLPRPSSRSCCAASLSSGPTETLVSVSLSAMRFAFPSTVRVPVSSPSYRLAECGLISARPSAALSWALRFESFSPCTCSAPTCSWPLALRPFSPDRSTGASCAASSFSAAPACPLPVSSSPKRRDSDRG